MRIRSEYWSIFPEKPALMEQPLKAIRLYIAQIEQVPDFVWKTKK